MNTEPEQPAESLEPEALDGDEPQEEVSTFDLTPDGEEPSLQGPPPDVQERFEALQEERDELESKLMRTAADYQNYVRRAGQNLEASKQHTIADIAKAMVGVLDHFDRALEVDPEKTSAADLAKGVESIRGELLKALEGFGVKRLEVEPGDEFDPNLHEALMRQPVEDVESDHIAAQFLPGYVLGDRSIRPAQVSVAE